MIINSLLDTDFYKFTMMQVVLHHYARAYVEYQFCCRTTGIDLSPYVDEINAEINKLCELQFDNSELAYLAEFPYLQSDFIEFLRLFKLNRAFIKVYCDNGLQIRISGPWLHTILFEVPVLAIVSEVYMRNQYPDANINEGRKRLQEKIAFVKDSFDPGEFTFSDFGTRRRFSVAWHREVVQTITDQLDGYLRGTSNVMFSREFNLPPIGTMAHEYIQAHQVLAPNLRSSQKVAFETWVNEYRGQLAIALSDTYSVDVFLEDFDLYLSKIYEGARQDSGKPKEWGERLIAHYQKFDIDPKTKRIVFSDKLDFHVAAELCRHFKGKIDTHFGIGTHLSNDLSHSAIQIVIKMTHCNGQPVAKITDDPEKAMEHDPQYVAHLKDVFGLD